MEGQGDGFGRASTWLSISSAPCVRGKFARVASFQRASSSRRLRQQWQRGPRAVRGGGRGGTTSAGGHTVRDCRSRTGRCCTRNHLAFACCHEASSPRVLWLARVRPVRGLPCRPPGMGLVEILEELHDLRQPVCGGRGGSRSLRARGPARVGRFMAQHWPRTCSSGRRSCASGRATQRQRVTRPTATDSSRPARGRHAIATTTSALPCSAPSLPERGEEHHRSVCCSGREGFEAVYIRVNLRGHVRPNLARPGANGRRQSSVRRASNAAASNPLCAAGRRRARHRAAKLPRPIATRGRQHVLQRSAGVPHGRRLQCCSRDHDRAGPPRRRCGSSSAPHWPCAPASTTSHAHRVATDRTVVVRGARQRQRRMRPPASVVPCADSACHGTSRGEMCAPARRLAAKHGAQASWHRRAPARRASQGRPVTTSHSAQDSFVAIRFGELSQIHSGAGQVMLLSRFAGAVGSFCPSRGGALASTRFCGENRQCLFSITHLAGTSL